MCYVARVTKTLFSLQFDTLRPFGDNDPLTMEQSDHHETYPIESASDYQANFPSDEFLNSLKRDGKFACNTCSAETKTKFDMQRHLRIHMGIKLFKCFFCDKSCARKTSLKRHCFNIHQLSKEEFDRLARIHLPNTS